MNIFLLHQDYKKSATMFAAGDPIRARKQLLESCQIIASVEHIAYGKTMMVKKDGLPYRPAHIHHPCVVWSSTSTLQWHMLVYSALELAKVYPYHACSYSLSTWIMVQDDPPTLRMDDRLVVVRRGQEHKIVHTLEEYAQLMLTYLRETKDFPL